jgi:hypothetical protein
VVILIVILVFVLRCFRGEVGMGMGMGMEGIGRVEGGERVKGDGLID